MRTHPFFAENASSRKPRPKAFFILRLIMAERDTHSFDTQLAQKVGLVEAIMLSHIKFLQKNFCPDGEDWTKYSVRRSIKKMCEIYPYLTSKQIRGALDRLCAGDYLMTANTNENPFDRVKSYVLGPEALVVFNIDVQQPEGQNDLPKGQMTFDERANPDLPKGQMLNDSSSSDSSSFLKKEKEENEIPKENQITDLIAASLEWIRTGGAATVRSWAETARFRGDVEEQASKFWMHRNNVPAERSHIWGDPLPYFKGGFPGWLMNANQFKPKEQKPVAATVKKISPYEGVQRW